MDQISMYARALLIMNELAAYISNGISLLAAEKKDRRRLKGADEYSDWTNIGDQVLEELEPFRTFQT